jgi:peptidoglycan hydrolase-like protein with peptidoglycan-binding domain
MATLQEGSKGDEVKGLQEALVAQGYYVGSVDGVFGIKTGVALGYFQSCNNLAIDGVAGPQVFELLGIGSGAQPGAVEMTLPAADARISNFVYDVEVNASTETDVRVVVWFQTGGEQIHAEESVHVPANGNATAAIEIPESLRDAEAEVHTTVLAFLPGQNEHPADQKASHFWVDKI